MMVKGYKIVEVEVMYKPSLVVEVGEKRKIIENLLEQLEENDDVQGVYANI
jgi:transcriptional/translational regulatory protein YebC/TACO1